MERVIGDVQMRVVSAAIGRKGSDEVKMVNPSIELSCVIS